MKRILIVIHDMEIGGAQKSLLAFLQTLTASGDSGQYDISLLLLNPTGPFLSQIPKEIRVLEPERPLRWMGSHMGPELLTKHFSLRGLYGECKWIVHKRLKSKAGGLNTPQKLWRCWRNLIPQRTQEYDVAIAYIDGLPAYYVIDKVRAKKKVLWVHSEYQMQGYSSAFDRPYYDSCDALVTISPRCMECVLKEFPQCDHKMIVLENISAYQNILNNSRAGACLEFVGYTGTKIVTVGRLHEQKGIDIALKAATLLAETGMDFRWIVVGEGSERPMLEQMLRDSGLKDRFQLIGARDNPYPYMREADIIVQPSRVEGKSIVLDEAKMLCKPIVSTRYATVGDSVRHGENGWTTPITPEGLYEGVLHMMNHPELMEQFASQLQTEPKGNEESLQRYIDILF